MNKWTPKPAPAPAPKPAPKPKIRIEFEIEEDDHATSANTKGSVARAQSKKDDNRPYKERRNDTRYQRQDTKRPAPFDDRYRPETHSDIRDHRDGAYYEQRRAQDHAAQDHAAQEHAAQHSQRDDETGGEDK